MKYWHKSDWCPCLWKWNWLKKVMDVSQIVTLYGKFETLNLAFGDFFLSSGNWNCYKSDWCVSTYLYIVCFNFFFAGARTADSLKIIHNHQMVCRLFGRYRHFNGFPTRVIVPTTVRKGLKKFICLYLPYLADFMAQCQILRGGF